MQKGKKREASGDAHYVSTPSFLVEAEQSHLFEILRFEKQTF